MLNQTYNVNSVELTSVENFVMLPNGDTRGYMCECRQVGKKTKIFGYKPLVRKKMFLGSYIIL